MAIIGLTDRTTLRPRLPRLGKLRKGGEKSKNKRGVDLNYFRLAAESDEVLAAFNAAYGDKPQLVNIVLFHETLEENFETWIEAWDASGLIFRSDGENYHIWREGSEYKRGLKPHEDVDGQSIVGRLEFVVPELLQQGFVGTITMETHSNHDLRNIAAVLAVAERENNGLRGCPFILRRVEREISVPGFGDREGKRSKVKKWLVTLEAPRRIMDNYLTNEQAAYLPAPQREITTNEPKTYGSPSAFFDRVQEKTDEYYKNIPHLKTTLGGNWPDWTDREAVATAGKAAIAHVVEKHLDEANEQKPLFTEKNTHDINTDAAMA